MLTITRTHLLALGLLGLSLATACRDSDAPVPAGDCAGPSASAAGRVVVQVSERLLATGPQLVLHCRDEVGHPCGNYTLQASLKNTSGSLSLSFPGVSTPTVCLTNIGPATAQLDLSTLPTGTYPLSLQVGARHTTGTLRIQPTKVELTTCDSNTVAVRNGLLLRIPANTVWGQLYARTPAAQTAALALLDSLRREGAQPLTLPAGNYGYFRVDAAGQLVPYTGPLSGQPATAIATPVLLRFSGSFARLRGVVGRRAQAGDLSAGLYFYNGERTY